MPPFTHIITLSNDATANILRARCSENDTERFFWLGESKTTALTSLSQRYLNTGGDPRTLPDYAALRDELAKLSPLPGPM